VQLGCQTSYGKTKTDTVEESATSETAEA
jgi:hypothetical protein